MGGTSGESEERIRQLFEDAKSNAPSILFIDSFDVIAAKKEVIIYKHIYIEIINDIEYFWILKSSQRGMDRRIIAQLFDSIDSISSSHENIDDIIGIPNDIEDSKRQDQCNPVVILMVATNK